MAKVGNRTAKPARTTARKSSTAKQGGNEALAPASCAALSPAERRERIKLAAYCRAERRGFVGGDPVQDWLEAEAEINAMFPSALPG